MLLLPTSMTKSISEYLHIPAENSFNTSIRLAHQQRAVAIDTAKHASDNGCTTVADNNFPAMGIAALLPFFAHLKKTIGEKPCIKHVQFPQHLCSETYPSNRVASLNQQGRCRATQIRWKLFA